jgi:hypothetical protein
MESWRDISNSLSAYLRSRLVNPIFGAYLVTWSVINFRLLLVLFGAGTWQEKIRYIDTRLYPEEWHWLVFGIAYPLGVAVLLVLGTPFINRWSTVFLRAREAETTRQLLVLQKETPMPKAEAAQLRRQLLAERESRLEDQEQAEKLRMEQAAQIDLLLQENKKLKSANDGQAAIKTHDTTDLVVAPKTYEIRESDLIGVSQRVMAELMRRGITHLQATALFAVRNGENFNTNILANVMGLSERRVALVLLDQLKGLGLIESKNFASTDTYQISSAGRQALEAVLARGFTPTSNEA